MQSNLERYWRNADMILDSLDGLVSAVQGKDLGKAEGPSNKLLCKTQEQCDAVASAANACSKRRIDMLQSYDDGCQAVGVMGNTIATLCGCMFVSAVDVCVLSPVPFICGIPYASYVPVFMSTRVLWGAVQLSTMLCAVVGSPVVASS